MVSADEVARSLRGANAFLTRRPEGLGAFRADPESFWRSFAAYALTLPAIVVAVAAARNGLGLAYAGPDLLADPGLAASVALAHVSGLLIGPAFAVSVAQPLGWSRTMPAFIVVSNWLAVFGSLAMALPTALQLGGLATPDLAALYTAAFAGIVIHVQWFAARLTLGLGAVPAAAVALAGFALAQVPAALLQTLLASG